MEQSGVATARGAVVPPYVLAEQLQALRRSWLEVAAEAAPQAPEARSLLAERLLELAGGDVPTEETLLRISEEAASAALGAAGAAVARSLSKRLRRCVYEFLLAIDAAVVQIGMLPSRAEPTALPVGTGTIVIGAEELEVDPPPDAVVVPPSPPEAATPSRLDAPHPASDPTAVDAPRVLALPAAPPAPPHGWAVREPRPSGGGTAVLGPWPRAGEAAADPDAGSPPPAPAGPAPVHEEPTVTAPAWHRPELTVVSSFGHEPVAQPVAEEPVAPELEPAAERDVAVAAEPAGPVIPSYRAWADVIAGAGAPEGPVYPLPTALPAAPDGPRPQRRASSLLARMEQAARGGDAEAPGGEDATSAPDAGEPASPAAPAAALSWVRPDGVPLEGAAAEVEPAAVTPSAERPARPSAPLAPISPAAPLWAVETTASVEDWLPMPSVASSSPPLTLPVRPVVAPPRESALLRSPSQDATDEAERDVDDVSARWSVRALPRRPLISDRSAERRREEAVRAAAELVAEEPESGGRRRRSDRDAAPLSADDVTPQVEQLLLRKRGADAAALLQRAAQELGGRAISDLALDSGDRCRAVGQGRAAINCFLAAWRADPLYEAPLWRLADTCLSDRNVDLAVGYLERIADLHLARRDEDGALAVYRKIVTVAPERRDIRDLLRHAQATGRLPD